MTYGPYNVQASKHLRVVATGATNDITQWGVRAMSFPQMITRMTVVWLGALPPDKTQGFGMPYLKSLLDPELQQARPELVSQVSDTQPELPRPEPWPDLPPSSCRWNG